MKRGKLITLFCILAGILVLAKVVTALLLEMRLPKVLERSCQENGWVLDNGTVHANWFSWGFEIRNLAIHREPGRKHFDLSISRLRFDGIHPFSLWFRKDIRIRKVTLEGGRLDGIAALRGDSTPIKTPLPVRIGSMELQDFGAHILDTGGIMAIVVQQGSANFADLDFEKDEAFVCKAFAQCILRAGRLKFVTADSLYTLAVDGMAYTASAQQLSALKFRVIPNYEDYEFTGRQQFQVDCIDAEFYGVAVAKFPFAHCLSSGSILSGLVRVDSMKLGVFRDRRKQDPRTPMPMVQQALYDLPIRLSIDSVVLGGGSIAYTEHIRATDRKSTVKFTDVKARFTGITNDTNTLHRWMHLETEARLLGLATIRCSIRGKLFDRGHNLQFKGSVGSMNATAFNAILEKSAPVKVKSGILDQMHFTFGLNAKQSSGTMNMLYHDLHLSANAEFAPKPMEWLQFIVFLGSKKVLEANPLEGKQIREGEIGIQRDIEKSIFNYCLQSLLSGSMSTMDMKLKKKPQDDV